MSDLPEPMTVRGCDLRDFPFMPLDCTRLMDSDLFALAKGDEFKAAVALWCKSWSQVPAGSLPDDDRVLAHLSGAGPAWKKVRAMALRGWVKCADGRLYHPIVAEKANEAWGKKQAQRERGRKGNEARWGSRKDGPSTPTAIPQGSQNDPASSPSAILVVSQGTVDSRKKEEAKPLAAFPDPRDAGPQRDASARLVTPRHPAANDPPEAWLHLADRNPDGSPKRENEPGTAGHGRPIAGGSYLDVAAQHVAEEAGWPADWRGDWTLLAEWLRSGADLHGHVLPTVRRLAAALRAKPGAEVAGTLRYFDGAVRTAAGRLRA